jgi:signal transduction histidine kinase
MSLTTRLLLFFLGSLVVVLCGFSSAVYFVAEHHLDRQAAERVEAALNTLGAAVEVTPDGVEWDTTERTLRLAPGPEHEQIVWLVTDGACHVVARSEHPYSAELLSQAPSVFEGRAEASRRVQWRDEPWQLAQRWFAPGTPGTPASAARPADPKEMKYPALVVLTALPLQPTLALLHKLLIALVIISLGVLGLASVAGGYVCRRALDPERRMAADARAIEAEAERRIAAPAGGDELTDLAVAFNGLLDRLQESVERHRRFAGDASHQLRTPLAALLGQIEVALRRDRSADEYRETLTIAQAKATHLTRIVESLLFLTRASAEAGLPSRERCELGAWLASHVAQWAGHARAADLHVMQPAEPMAVLTHPVLLGEALNVLLDNACRYSRPGTPIALSLSKSDGRVRIEVADEGQGIEAADLPQLFTPFFRTSEALRANRTGIGLGLSIARRLAVALAGELSVTSEPGRGSRFVLTLAAERASLG